MKVEDASDTLAAVLRSEVEWEKVEKLAPAPMLRLLHRCLDRDQRNRLRDVGDARISIQEYLADPSAYEVDVSATLQQSVSSWQKVGLVGAVLASLLVGLVAGWLARPAPSPPDSIRFNVNVSAEQPLYTNYGSAVALSPDGTRLAYVTGNSASSSRLHLRPLGSLEAEVVSGMDSAFNPVFSPDGQWIAFTTSNELKKVSVTGGAAVPLCKVNLSRGASWGPDDTIVFAPNNSGLMRVSTAGGEPQEVTTLQEGEVWPIAGLSLCPTDATCYLPLTPRKT